MSSGILFETERFFFSTICFSQTSRNYKLYSILTVSSRYPSSPPEIPVTFTVPLREQSVVEHGSITLECELSKPNQKVTWLKNGADLSPSEHVNITTEETIHKLILPDALMEDDAEYTIRLENGEQSSAHLIVEGWKTSLN